MKLDAVQLQEALDAMFAELMPKLRDMDVKDERIISYTRGGPDNSWEREFKHEGTEVLIKYEDIEEGRFFCRIQRFEKRDGHTWSVFLLSGVSHFPHCPILNWRISDTIHLNAQALATWLVGWTLKGD